MREYFRARARRVLSLGVLCLLAAFALGGCVLTMPQELIHGRNLPDGTIPNISGDWRDDQNADVKISRGEFNNVFLAVAQSQRDSALKVTLERIDGDLYVVQVDPEGGQGVFLAVGQLTANEIRVFTFPDRLPELQKMAAANGITISDAGLIVKYSSAEGVANFLRALSQLSGHEDLVLRKK
ncbi:MAG: hypothetical protein LBO66_05240 [Deltaproteobacteria bacterium]|jgi:hypothetical protein|nr:hypothetical protein [Deltaproteobacteria bacterium]